MYEYLDIDKITITTVLISILFGLLLNKKLLWNYRKYSSFIVVLAIGISSGLVAISGIHWFFKLLILACQAYRVFSYLRVVQDRSNYKELRLKSYRTEIVLSFEIILLIFLNYILEYYFTNFNIVYFISIIQIISIGVYWLYFRHSLDSSRVKLVKKHIADTELPSITVAIPARNETYDLTDCLQSIFASNYPKMDVLVYDDCSQDTTSQIIKDFAHDGARFIEGRIPPPGWMPKNFAYDRLLEEADGKYILFCGTDVRFQRESIRNLVEQLVTYDKQMISILPIRNGLSGVHQIIQPMRYWRELVMPSIQKTAPPTLSTVWIADTKMLIKYGGFKAFKKSIRPEKHFSKRFNFTNKYSFFRASSGLGISSAKGYKAQWNTAVRTRYPELSSRPEKVFLFSVWEILVFLLPLPVLIISVYLGQLVPAIFSLLSTVTLLVICYKLDHYTNGQGSFRKVVLFPVSVISEIVASNYSMWAYEFSQVMWKGRNICLPVLRAVPKLPKI